jgi:hypothetical protein
MPVSGCDNAGNKCRHGDHEKDAPEPRFEILGFWLWVVVFRWIHGQSLRKWLMMKAGM